jgi:transposase
MTREVRRYTKEFKTEAIKLALKSPCISSTATSLGIPKATLHTWLSEYKKPSVMDEINGKDIAVLVAENRSLHKELAKIKEEKEILKKAAQYFAQYQK